MAQLIMGYHMRGAFRVVARRSRIHHITPHGRFVSQPASDIAARPVTHLVLPQLPRRQYHRDTLQLASSSGALSIVLPSLRRPVQCTEGTGERDQLSPLLLTLVDREALQQMLDCLVNHANAGYVQLMAENVYPSNTLHDVRIFLIGANQFVTRSIVNVKIWVLNRLHQLEERADEHANNWSWSRFGWIAPPLALQLVVKASFAALLFMQTV